MRTQNNQYVISITNVHTKKMRGKFFWLMSSQPIGYISSKFGISGRLKQALGTQWKLRVSKVFASSEADPSRLQHISPSTSVVGVIKKVLLELGFTFGNDCTTLIVRENNPEKTDVIANSKTTSND